MRTDIKSALPIGGCYFSSTQPFCGPYLYIRSLRRLRSLWLLRSRYKIPPLSSLVGIFVDIRCLGNFSTCLTLGFGPLSISQQIKWVQEDTKFRPCHSCVGPNLSHTLSLTLSLSPYTNSTPLHCTKSSRIRVWYYNNKQQLPICHLPWSLHWLSHYRRNRRSKEKRASATMASKLAAFWNHPAGPKTSEHPFFSFLVPISFLLSLVCLL